MRRLREELLGDVGLRLAVGGRGQRRDRNAAQRFARLGQQTVFGPEVMAPLRDAMRLVDGEPGHPEAPQPVDQPLAGQPLGRDEEQAQIAGVEPVPGLGRLALAVHRIERGGGDAGPHQLADLIAHQGDQRRDDEGEPAGDEGGKLVAHRLAGARRHHRENVAAGKRGFDHFPLTGAEIIIAEH